MSAKPSLMLLFSLQLFVLSFGTLFSLQSLDRFKWNNRLVLISAPSSQDQDFEDQKHFFAGKEEEILDRDIVIIELIGTSQSRIDNQFLDPSVADKIREELILRSMDFELLLVGKDGTVKLRSSEPVDSSQIFGLIDSMPMRRSEMKQRGSIEP